MWLKRSKKKPLPILKMGNCIFESQLRPLDSINFSWQTLKAACLIASMAKCNQVPRVERSVAEK